MFKKRIRMIFTHQTNYPPNSGIGRLQGQDENLCITYNNFSLTNEHRITQIALAMHKFDA